MIDIRIYIYIYDLLSGKFTVEPRKHFSLVATSMNQPLSARVVKLIYWRVYMLSIVSLDIYWSSYDYDSDYTYIYIYIYKDFPIVL